jgi:hypothetical protein
MQRPLIIKQDIPGAYFIIIAIYDIFSEAARDIYHLRAVVVSVE